MAKDGNYTKSELKDIINSEIKKFVTSEFDDTVKKILAKRNSASRDEVIKVVKDGMGKFAEFMYVRKNIWQNDIK